MISSEEANCTFTSTVPSMHHPHSLLTHLILTVGLPVTWGCDPSPTPQTAVCDRQPLGASDKEPSAQSRFVK